MQPEGVLQTLIQSLRCLPGVGAKSAQRMAFFLLQQDRDGARRLARALSEASEKINYCSHCRTFSELEICSICANTARNTEQLCILENPSDVWSIEQAGFYRGRYFVLHGRLSPLDGIGPEQLNIDLLEQRLLEGSIKELVLATNSTVEGEATAHFIAGLANKYNVKATRIAHGVPMGGELEYIDSGTLAHAFNGRQIMDL